MDTRFGEYLVFQEIITIKQLIDMLKIQVKLDNEGNKKKIGEIIIDELHTFDAEELDKLLEEYYEFIK